MNITLKRSQTNALTIEKLKIEKYFPISPLHKLSNKNLLFIKKWMCLLGTLKCVCALWAGNLISSSANLFMFLARGRQVDEDLLVNFVSFYTWYYLDHVHGFSCQCAPTWYMQCTRTCTVEVYFFLCWGRGYLFFSFIRPLKVKIIQIFIIYLPIWK